MSLAAMYVWIAQKIMGMPNASPAKRAAFGRKEQQKERAMSLKKLVASEMMLATSCDPIPNGHTTGDANFIPVKITSHVVFFPVWSQGTGGYRFDFKNTANTELQRSIFSRISKLVL